MKENTFRHWVGVDFDGTLATYDHYRGDDHVGQPVEPIVRLVRKFLHDGVEVRLFTARKPHPVLRKWMKEHLGQMLPITNVKDPGMIAMYDDRAINVQRNTGKLSGAENVQTGK
jgi:hypothetical protein